MIGFDLGTAGFKVVELKRRFGRFVIAGQNQTNLETGLVSRNGIKQSESFARLFTVTLKDAKPKSIRGKTFIAALPESFLYTKNISLPTKNPKEVIRILNYTLQFEAAEIFPVSADEVYLDYQISAQDKESTNVLVVASPKGIVDDFLKIVDSIGYEVRAIETKALALGRLFFPKNRKPSVVFCDIGAKVSKLSIFNTRQLTLAITTAVGATDLRKKIGNAHHLGKEILNSIEFYQSKYHQSDWQPEKIIISGGGAHVPRVARELTKTTNIPSEIGQPSVAIEGYDPQFAVAYGLALGME
jgi:type IV pilus assembly protein PilM